MNFSLNYITDSLSENFLYHVALLALFIGTKKNMHYVCESCTVLRLSHDLSHESIGGLLGQPIV